MVVCINRSGDEASGDRFSNRWRSAGSEARKAGYQTANGGLLGEAADDRREMI